jgi:hypothetical protein
MRWELYAPPLVEIGLTYVTKSGGAIATPAPWAPTGLLCTVLALHSGELQLILFKHFLLSGIVT